MKRKELGESARDEEDEIIDIKKGKIGKSEQKKDQTGTSSSVGAFEGGFVGSQGTGAYLGSLDEAEPMVKGCKTKAPAQQKEVKIPQEKKVETLREKKTETPQQKKVAAPQEKKKETPKSIQNNRPQKAVQINSSSSSSSDSESDSGRPVAMVTAQSVFTNKPQRRGRRGGRGKSRPLR